MEHDAWFFIGVFVFIFIIWIATGGPLRPFPLTAPAFPKPTAFADGGAKISLPQAPFGIGGSNVVLRDPNEGVHGSSYYSGGSYGQNSAPLTGIAFGTPSQYRNLVTMSTYVVGASSTNPNSEYVQIMVSQNAGTSVDITGWKLISEATGKSAVIPQGTPIPTSGIVNRKQDIILMPGESAALISGGSPIGTSFRENLCTGYFSYFQDFSPYLPQNCPVPREELAAHYGPYYVRDVQCLDYANSLPRCQPALYAPREYTNACRTFILDYLTYNGCVIHHQNDVDFNGHLWHVYLGFAKHLWRSQHEVLKLVDTSGKTVDAISY